MDLTFRVTARIARPTEEYRKNSRRAMTITVAVTNAATCLCWTTTPAITDTSVPHGSPTDRG